MKTVVWCFLVFYMSAAFAQITFTREWVKGKRSTTANGAAAAAKDEHTLCRSLVSAVEYLIELEKLRRVECSECCRTGPPAFPVLPDIQRSPSDFMTFLREIPPQEQEQLEKMAAAASNQVRRNQ